MYYLPIGYSIPRYVGTCMYMYIENVCLINVLLIGQTNERMMTVSMCFFYCSNATLVAS